VGREKEAISCTELLEKAECVIVIPSVKKLAFGIGADYGRGAMVCRTGEKFRGPWGAPAMYAQKDIVRWQSVLASLDQLRLVAPTPILAASPAN
jgi:hypothetical protein